MLFILAIKDMWNGIFSLLKWTIITTNIRTSVCWTEWHWMHLALRSISVLHVKYRWCRCYIRDLLYWSTPYNDVHSYFPSISMCLLSIQSQLIQLRSDITATYMLSLRTNHINSFLIRKSISIDRRQRTIRIQCFASRGHAQFLTPITSNTAVSDTKRSHAHGGLVSPLIDELGMRLRYGWVTNEYCQCCFVAESSALRA